MAIPDRMDIKNRFPDLSSVNRELFPTSIFDRTTISDYAASLEKLGRLTPVVADAIEKAKGVRENTRAVVYIAGGLTGVDEVTKERYGETSNFLGTFGKMGSSQGDGDVFFGYVPHLHGTDPVKHPNVTAEEVRDVDHLWAVVVADFHINFFDPVAHGNAIELGWAADHMIPTIGQNTTGNKLSRLTLGMENLSIIIEYDDFKTDGVLKLGVEITEFATWLKIFPDKDPREYHYRSPQLLRNPLLIENGLETDGFSPEFGIDQFIVYVKDPESEHCGEVGQILYHDWNDSGDIGVALFDSEEEVIFNDSSSSLSYWLK